MSKKFLFIFLLTLISVFFSLLIMEISLRLLNFEKWKYFETDHESFFKTDEELGWIAKEGTYNFQETKKNNNIKKIKILEDGHRNTGKNTSKDKILIIGGSFTQGWNVDDEETFAFQIQNKTSRHKVLNFGQSGYSGLQSLLLLKRVIKSNINTKYVIYGFIPHHEYRNVARGEWLRTLAKYKSRGHSDTPKIPYALIDKKKDLLIKDLIGYPNLPLKEHSALITLVERKYMRILTKRRKKIQDDVAKKIFLEMSQVSKENDAKFILIGLSTNLKKYENFLKKNNINFKECNLNLTRKFLIENDYHPNYLAHNFYSKCIIEKIKKI